MRLSQAQALSGQTELDGNYTHAIAIKADGTTPVPVISSTALAQITGTTNAETLPKDVPVTYSYAPDDESEPAEINVTVRILENGIDFIFYKVNEKQEPLAGVEFVMYPRDAAGTGWDMDSGVTFVSAVDGKVTLVGLSGEYLLTETKTHAGYALPTGEWILTVDEADGSIAFSVTGSPMAFAFDGATYTLTNYKEFLMPIAGGIGMLLFTVGGITLIGLAMILKISFVKRNRRREKIIRRMSKPLTYHRFKRL